MTLSDRALEWRWCYHHVILWDCMPFLLLWRMIRSKRWRGKEYSRKEIISQSLSSITLIHTEWPTLKNPFHFICYRCSLCFWVRTEFKSTNVKTPTNIRIAPAHMKDPQSTSDSNAGRVSFVASNTGVGLRNEFCLRRRFPSKGWDFVEDSN